VERWSSICGQSAQADFSSTTTAPKRYCKGGGIYSSSKVALTLIDSNVEGNKATTGFDELYDGP
jgi:hypothetical protein